MTDFFIALYMRSFRLLKGLFCHQTNYRKKCSKSFNAESLHQTLLMYINSISFSFYFR